MKYFLILFLIFSCASPKLKKEIEQEKQAVTSKQILMSSNQIFTDSIKNSTTLTSEQKEKLLAIQKDVDTKTQTIDLEIKKLKILLYENLSDKNGSDKKMNTLVRRLKKLSYQKIDIMLKALYEIKEIIGRTSKEKYYQIKLYDI